MLIKFLALFLAVTVTHGLPADVALPRANHPDVGLSIVSITQKYVYHIKSLILLGSNDPEARLPS